MLKNNLFFREWLVVFVVFLSGALVFLSSANYSFNFSDGDGFCETRMAPGPVDQKKIQVEVSGEVDSPGVYEVIAGATVKSVLERVGLKSSADKRSCNVKKILLTSCKIHVLEKNSKKSKKREEKKIALR